MPCVPIDNVARATPNASLFACDTNAEHVPVCADGISVGATLGDALGDAVLGDILGDAAACCIA